MKIRYMVYFLLLTYYQLAQGQDNKIEYEMRISHAGSGDIQATTKTQYCKNTRMKCGKEVKIAHNGTLLFKAYYKNGQYDGEVLSYYANGVLREKRTYIEGKEEGKSILYYPNAKIQSEQTYKLNKREGEGKRYYQNGVMEAYFTYKDDKLEGLKKEFTIEGALMYEILYKGGKKQTMKRYNAQGLIVEEKNCRWQTCY